MTNGSGVRVVIEVRRARRILWDMVIESVVRCVCSLEQKLCNLNEVRGPDVNVRLLGRHFRKCSLIIAVTFNGNVPSLI